MGCHIVECFGATISLLVQGGTNISVLDRGQMQLASAMWRYSCCMGRCRNRVKQSSGEVLFCAECSTDFPQIELPTKIHVCSNLRKSTKPEAAKQGSLLMLSA